MDYLLLWLILQSVMLVVFVEDVSCNLKWRYLSLRYGLWDKPPKTPSQALHLGYRRINDVCKMDTYHGFMFVETGNDKSRIIFDLNGNMAGIQTMIPGNLKGYNSRNETIRLPPKEVIPPILLDTEQSGKDIQMYTITVYFKHPRLICSPYAPNVRADKGFYLQTGYNVERQYEQIPLESKYLSPDWIAHKCNPKMGLHYFKNLTPKMKCEELYPVFLMYNSEGQLGAFGWSFQGSPSAYLEDELTWFRLSPLYYPFIYDQSKLPACMFNPDFQVFGMHFWLRDPDTMLCPVVTVPMKDNEYKTTPRMRTTPVTKIDKNIIVDKIIRDSFNSGHSVGCGGRFLVLNLIVCLVFSVRVVQSTLVSLFSTALKCVL